MSTEQKQTKWKRRARWLAQRAMEWLLAILAFKHGGGAANLFVVASVLVGLGAVSALLLALLKGWRPEKARFCSVPRQLDCLAKCGLAAAAAWHGFFVSAFCWLLGWAVLEAFARAAEEKEVQP